MTPFSFTFPKEPDLLHAEQDLEDASNFKSLALMA